MSLPDRKCWTDRESEETREDEKGKQGEVTMCRWTVCECVLAHECVSVRVGVCRCVFVCVLMSGPQWMTRRPALSQQDPSCSCLHTHMRVHTHTHAHIKECVASAIPALWCSNTHTLTRFYDSLTQSCRHTH